MTLRFSLLKALPVALSAALGTLMVGWGEDAGAQPCIQTHSSLNLGCLTRDQWERKIQEWAPRYKAVHGFANQWGLGAINADRAYAHLKAIMGEGVKPGQGVTIGIVDNGVNPDHPSFVGRTTHKGPPFKKGTISGYHGMPVASVAAGGQIADKSSSHGVAWGASIFSIEDYNVLDSIVWEHPDSGKDVDKYDPEDFARTLQHIDDKQAKKFKAVLSEGIDILSISVGLGRGTIEHYNKRHLRQDYGKSIAALAQADAEEKTILVWAAGNNSSLTASRVSFRAFLQGKTDEEIDSIVKTWTDSSAFGGGLPALIPELRGHSVAVVATQKDGAIADYSNHCGMAADWCMAAPASGLTALKVDESTKKWYWGSVSGTSFAAPMVSGSLAVMKQLFRNQLSNTELVTRLFATANKTGIYANRAIYGQGFLDLGAATNPWGMVGFLGEGQSVVGAQAQAQVQDSPGDPGEVEPSEANACGKSTIKTHASLGLGCLTRAEWNEKVQEWAKAYRAVPGFGKQWGLGAINADRAYAHLKAVQGEGVRPGQGVTIGFVDSGIDPSHPSFAASKVSQKLMRGAAAQTGSRVFHGTSVASVAAGGRVSSGGHQSMAHHGVAWGADIAMFAIPAEVYPVTRRVGLFARDKADADFFQSVLSKNIDILNLSFPSAPFPGTIDDYRKSRLQRNYKKTVAALAQKGKEEKTILVWSAGDVDPSRDQTPGSSPQLMAGLPARMKELRGHSVAVVATKQDGAIADFSNRCGRAADWCIAAPGQNVQGAGAALISDHAWVTWSSTSLAAPMVSGGLAVMKQLFRDQLSNTELVSRLFSTAKKSGIHADRSIYGQGLMDLGAATNPWGMAAFMGTGQAVGSQSRGDSVGGQGGVELSSTSLSLGSAMGDGLSEALARQEIAAFDSLGAPFWFSAGSFTLPAEGPSLAARFQQFLAPSVEPTIPETWQVDFQNAAPALEAGHLALTHGADRLSFHGPQGLSATPVPAVPGLRPSAPRRCGSFLESHNTACPLPVRRLPSRAGGAIGQPRQRRLRRALRPHPLPEHGTGHHHTPGMGALRPGGIGHGHPSGGP